ncbi:MAG TPA: alginate lyase family protein [Candidatus Acidoferrales bacterium]|nr:alginate lyase family protein [Candidatus Acidoferrales bacterium]
MFRNNCFVAGRLRFWTVAVAMMAGLWLAPMGHAQSLIMSDDFEGAGTTVDPTIWPLSLSTHVESGLTWFGATNRYLRLTGGSTEALTVNWSPQLNGQPSTFAFDYYEPSTSSGSVTLGYAGGSDINAAGAFARLALTAGALSMSSASGVVMTASSTLTYPRDRRLTFSLALNHTAAPLSFNGGTLAGKTLDVWYYDWVTGLKSYVMTLSVTNAMLTPQRVGFRTFSAETGVQAYFDNVKLLNDLEVVTNFFAPSNPPPPAVTAVVPQRGFVHPSVFNTQEELDRIKYRVINEPTSAARLGWNKMTNSTYAQLSYQYHTFSNVVVAAGAGDAGGEDQFRQDAHAAYAAALQWTVTGNTQYRDKALTIMNAWGSTFIKMSPDTNTVPPTTSQQIHLEAAWVAPIWLVAADIIRYYNHGAAGWNSNDIVKFDGMLNYLYGQAAQATTMQNNWGASAALTMIGTGVYQGDRTRFNAGVQTWRTMMIDINAEVDSYNDDSIYEVCRDVTHPQYTLQVWQQAAEVAWTQGTNLYDMLLDPSGPPQFSRNLEYFGQLFMGLRGTPCGSSFDSTYSYPGKQTQSGAYDIAHNHYIYREGLTNLPTYADMVVNHYRTNLSDLPDEHFVGWSTLTHGDLSAGIPIVNALLWTNTLTHSGGPLADGDTINLHTNAGWVIGVQTTGTVSWVKYQTNDIQFSVTVSNVPFTPTNLPSPGDHFLSALPSQAKPAGSIPGDQFVRFVRVIDLSSNWGLNDIGVPALPSWAQETAAVLTVASPGSGAGGSADQCGFVAATIAGDLQITAQPTNMGALTASSVAGIMVREGTTTGSKNVFLSFAPLAASGLTLSCRTADQGATTNVVATGSGGIPWLRVMRLGDVFTAYASLDGKSWTNIGSATAAMNAQVQVGLAVASGVSNAVMQTDFRNMLIEPLSVSYAEWQNWMFTRRGITDPAVTASTADPDNDGRSNEAEYLAGSDPLVPDLLPPVQALNPVNGFVRCRFTERQNAAALGRVFLHSTDLVNWSPITPNSITVVADFGAVVTREVTFPVAATSGFYRSSY